MRYEVYINIKRRVVLTKASCEGSCEEFFHC